MAMSLSGCSNGGEYDSGGTAAETSLACAALISAADRLMVEGKFERDAEVMERGLVASMTYLNQHFIPKGIGERDAFAQVHAERDRMLASLPAAEIVSRAKACIQRMPQT